MCLWGGGGGGGTDGSQHFTIPGLCMKNTGNTADSADPDQTALKEQSDLGQHCYAPKLLFVPISKAKYDNENYLYKI